MKTTVAVYVAVSRRSYVLSLMVPLFINKAVAHDAFEDEVSAYPAITIIRRRPQGSAVLATRP